MKKIDLHIHFVKTDSGSPFAYGKYKWKVLFDRIIIIFIVLICVSCGNDDNSQRNYIDGPSLESLSFLKSDNASLEKDIIVKVDDSDSIINIFVPHLKRTDNLIASFEGFYDRIVTEWGGQISGVTENDYNNKVIFTLQKGEKERKYIVYFTGYNGIPKVDIETEFSRPVESKDDYIGANIEITNAPNFCGRIKESGKIRGRGHTSWYSYPKKPYKIKFDNSVNIFGDKNKDYVLLADYSDRSLLRTYYMTVVSSILEMPYTINCKHVELYLNGDYQGVYLLTDHIDRAKNRINIEDDGFIVEKDKFWQYEPLSFVTEKKQWHYTFKYPKADKGKIVEGDDNFLFIKNKFDKLEDELTKGHSVETLIDFESFAKWFICQEIIGNYDPNVFYVLHSKNDLLKMYPVWDAEWSMGSAVLKNDESMWLDDPQFLIPDVSIWDKRLYFPYLMLDSKFKSVLKQIWNKYKEVLKPASGILKAKAEEINYAQRSNFVKWPIMGHKVNVELYVANSFEEELLHIQEFYNKRYEWFESYINSL